MSTITTYLTMLRQSFSSFTYYQRLTSLTSKSIIIFYFVSFFALSLVFSGISFVQIQRSPALQTEFTQFINSSLALFSATPSATLSANLAVPVSTTTASLSATPSSELLTASSTSILSTTTVMSYLPIILFLIWPLATTIFTLPTILIETLLIYFLGRFQKRGLTPWTAAALSLHTTFIIQLLSQIIVMIYASNAIPDLLYLLHWVFIIIVIKKSYPLKTDAATPA